MSDSTQDRDAVLHSLRERTKELQSIYTINQILVSEGRSLDEMLGAVVRSMPEGWQYPESCQARITFHDRVFEPPGFSATPWVQSAPIVVDGDIVGSLSVYYTRDMPLADEGPFLKEERKLLETVAGLLGRAIRQRQVRTAGEELSTAAASAPDQQDWRILLDWIKRTNPNLSEQISRKMLNHLSYAGIQEAKNLLHALSAGRGTQEGEYDDNRPQHPTADENLATIADEIFQIATGHLGKEEILSLVQVWIREDRVSFLLQALESADTSISEIASAMEHYQHLGVKARDLTVATQVGLKTSLVRRLLTDHLEFVETSRKFLDVEDFYDLLNHTILLPKSHGKLGGKSSGLFLAAQIIRRSREHADVLSRIRIPKSWYLPSDALLQFLAYNELDDVYNWKYREIDQIRQEYPHIQHVFKSSRFPPDIVRGLSSALDSFENRPVIVRSSSLLEDQMGAAFSGKYKSLFLANQGSKPVRLAALLDAVAEVYASVFGPDPIQYRAERGLLDQHEEMGIMIQEVVGTRVGRYFLTAFSGVGFSNNEFRWSPRISRDDGLLRLVPGLGTRAVDRLADDYPVLVTPGQPNLRVNATPEESVRYSPRKIDVINLEENAFQTLEIRTLLREIGAQYPSYRQLASVFEDGRIRTPNALEANFDPAAVYFTFAGLVSQTPFVGTMKNLLSVLRGTLRTPVDIEFASDGQNLFLLQCRPQSYSQESSPATIPRDLPEDQIIFSAKRYVSNGKVPDITHIVYVDPERYGCLNDQTEVRDVGRAVGCLNKLLPRRRFILMGPGRWGSRGDIKLGVSVTYSDINNSAVLIEIARMKEGYVPDLSFGTHFFQDLVEANIRYLPLYPDDRGVLFQEEFFRTAPNILADLLPEFAYLSDVLRLIDVPRSSGGRVLHILMNADLDEAVGIFAAPEGTEEVPTFRKEPATRPSEDHSRWRLRVAERIAQEISFDRFGVKGFYLFGSTRSGTAGPDADIDIIIHFGGTPKMKADLELWLEGWSRCLSEMNYLRTGYQVEHFLDVRFATDEDLAKQSNFASKIGAVTDAARFIPLGKPTH